ncbi:hypothetical protein DL768_010563 [Monosporascus sp. mg162]|nr:hypothetical protein DL768_010563 [Monosporascus sp. mg162]
MYNCQSRSTTTPTTIGRSGLRSRGLDDMLWVLDKVTDGPPVRSHQHGPTVHCKDSYMKSLRFDLRPTPRSPGAGIAYIVDSRNETRNGFIMIDLATGGGWSHPDQHPSTLRVFEAVPSFQGLPFYSRQRGHPLYHEVS